MNTITTHRILDLAETFNRADTNKSNDGHGSPEACIAFFNLVGAICCAPYRMVLDLKSDLKKGTDPHDLEILAHIDAACKRINWITEGETAELRKKAG